MLAGFSLGFACLVTLTAALPKPQDAGLTLNNATMNTVDDVVKFGAITDRKITCQPGKGSSDRPKTDECVNALLRLPFTPDIIPFKTGTNPPTLRYRGQDGRCQLMIDPVDINKEDFASWGHVQTIAAILVSSCKYAFGQDSRTGGAVIFGREGNLKLQFVKLPRPNENGSANVTVGEDPEEVFGSGTFDVNSTT